MNEIAILRPFKKYFSHIRTIGGDNEWLFPMGPRQRLKRFSQQAGIDAGNKPETARSADHRLSY